MTSEARVKHRFVGHHVPLFAVFVAGALSFPGCASRNTSTYNLSATYSTLPANDKALSNWLEKKQGVVNPLVTRKGQEISIEFGTELPVSPFAIRELLDMCESFGYKGRSEYRGKFFDLRQRGTNRETLWVEFGSLPGDDGVIEKWLATAPGVSNPKVSRNGSVVVLAFDLANPPPPTILGDILKKCEQAGYKDQAGYVWAFGGYN